MYSGAKNVLLRELENIYLDNTKHANYA